VVPSGPDPVSSGAAVSSTSSPGGAGTHTLSSYAVPSVTNGILIVGAIAEDFLNIPSLTGVTFGGSAMTAMASPVLHNPQSDFQIETGLYYVLNPSGTGDIVVSGSASSGDLNRMGLIVLTVANVKQSAPTLISNTSAGATSISTTLNSVPDKALVVDMFWARTDGVVASETRQNVNDNEVITGGLRYYGGSDDLMVGSKTPAPLTGSPT